MSIIPNEGQAAEVVAEVGKFRGWGMEILRLADAG